MTYQVYHGGAEKILRRRAGGGIECGMDCDVLIVGSGAAGLSAARELRASGRRVTVVDKGRVVGGRMATREFDGGRFDYGAQFFSLRDEAFARVAAPWVESGLATHWHGHRYRAPHGVRRLAEEMAAGLDVRCGVTLMELEREGACWAARSSAGEVFRARAVILTPPVPQAQTLLGRLAPADLSGIHYHKTITLLVRVEGELRLPESGCLTPESGVLSWAADNFVKQVSPVPGCLTLHATHGFSETHWDSPASMVVAEMLGAAEPWIDGRVKAFYLHRWRYAEPVETWSAPFYGDAGLALAVAGDAFGGPRVGGAVSSGLAAAGWLLENFG